MRRRLPLPILVPNSQHGLKITYASRVQEIFGGSHVGGACDDACGLRLVERFHTSCYSAPERGYYTAPERGHYTAPERGHYTAPERGHYTADHD